MSTLDIRSNTKSEINRIVVHESELDLCSMRFWAGKVLIEDGTPLHNVQMIDSKEHANNLIKALNKAIELGWLK